MDGHGVKGRVSRPCRARRAPCSYGGASTGLSEHQWRGGWHGLRPWAPTLGRPYVGMSPRGSSAAPIPSRLGNSVNDWQKAVALVGALALLLLAWVVVLRPAPRVVETALIGVVAAFLLALAVYHLSHRGLPSGVIEVAGFLFLVAAAAISARRRP